MKRNDQGVKQNDQNVKRDDQDNKQKDQDRRENPESLKAVMAPLESEPAPLTISVPIKQYRSGTVTKVVEEILKEYRLSLYVGGRLLIHILCMPSHLEELVVGYLCTEGIITSYDDIASLRVNRETGRADVRLQTEGTDSSDLMLTTDSGDAVGSLGVPGDVSIDPVADLPCQAAAANQAGLTGRAGPTRHTGLIYQKQPVRQAGIAFDCEIVLHNANCLLAHSQLFRKTGSVHSVMLCRGAETLCFMEDVGRFSAFDKCVGRAVIKGWKLQDTCLYTTGRVPSTLVLKAARAGIPMVVSRSAPTDSALALAEYYGITVIGFARGDRMNIYSGTETEKQ